MCAFAPPLSLGRHTYIVPLPQPAPPTKFVSRRPVRQISTRRITITAHQTPPSGRNQSDGKSPVPRRFSRRHALLLLNASLGAATLTLIVKMKEQFRLLSLQSVLSSFGLSRLPFRTAVAPTLAAPLQTREQVEKAIEHIRSVEAHAKFPCPDFPANSDWINSRPLSLKKQLAGKIVLLDFFTYCCINCQHVLPKLRELELKYGDDGSAGVVVVGVHSAKFSAERDTANVAAAVDRYEVVHPVVNDEKMQMWGTIGLTSWPTLALVGPKGNLLSIWTGENQETDIDNLIAGATEYYADVLDRRPLPVAPKRTAVFGQLAKSPLRYPGKLAVSTNPASLWVSDSGNHRILQIDLGSGSIVRSFGNGEPGFVDAADGASAQFHTPQGIVEHDGKLFVADTESHAVRAIDLKSGAVTTVGGNGEQGFDYQGGKVGKDQQLSSPWDVEIFGNDLYVAMAGTHQIWCLPLSKTKSPSANSWRVFSGTGRELELNSAEGLLAAWAQPSHLSSAFGKGLMFVADSESSSIRAIDIVSDKNPTRTIAGGDGLLPENLFAFGDEDGRGSRAKFQHPLAVCYDGLTNRVFVADSYNHRIKVIDNSAVASVMCGSGKPGFNNGPADEAMFWEPAGLALSSDGSKLYVSDTNNFAIRVVDTQSGAVSSLAVVDTGAVPSSSVRRPLIPNRRRAIYIFCDTAKPTATLRFIINLPGKSHYTPGTTGRFQVNLKRDKSDDIADILSSGDVSTSKSSGSFSIDLSKCGNVSVGDELEIEATTYFCTDADDVCRVEPDVFKVTIATQGCEANSINHNISLRSTTLKGKTT